MGSSITIEVFEASSHRSVQAEWLDVFTPTGELTVGPGHSPVVSLLSPGSVATYKSAQGGMVDIQVPGGFLMVAENGVVKLLLCKSDGVLS